MSESEDSGTFRFECENGHDFKGPSSERCPYCMTDRVYLVKDGGERVPV